MDMMTEENNLTNELVDNESATDEIQEPVTETNEAIDTATYVSLDTETLIHTIKLLIDTAPIQNIKPHIEEAKKVFYERSNLAYAEALEKFKSEQSEPMEGEEEVLFEYSYPHSNNFKAILKVYKTKRDAFYKDQEKQMNANLKLKLELIEELKGLLNAEEKIKETFEHFKSIQQKWKSIGQVPISELNNLWQTYHHHVENFFDYLRINNDLRDIEFKRNLNQKISLCEKAEAISSEDNLDKAFAVLQELHSEWKEIGPVGKDHRESIWERFQSATKIIHKKRNDFFEERKQSFETNYQAKIALCELVESIDISALTHHNKWQKQTEIINELREDWKKIGPISREQNTISWARFMAAIKEYKTKKNDFYKELKKDQKSNLAQKKAIVEKAESLAESTDWQETANLLKGLQADWKTSGIAPKKEADLLWNRLKTACNTFFDKLNEQQAIKEKVYVANLAAKQKYLTEIEAFKNSGHAKDDVKSIMSFVNQWKELGKVPRKNVKSIETKFHKIIDSFFEQLDMDKSEKRDIQFKSKIEAIKGEEDESKLKDELYKFQQSAKKCKDELVLLETNMSFFKHAKDDNPLIKEARNNIDKQKEKLEELKSRIAFIKSVI